MQPTTNNPPPQKRQKQRTWFAFKRQNAARSGAAPYSTLHFLSQMDHVPDQLRQ
jgi:hypothetical protein